MNRKLLLIPVLIAIAAGGGLLARRAPVTTENALVLQGNVDIRRVELAFNASGRILEIGVREGDAVQRGQVLARLDVERLQLGLAQAMAQAEGQRAVLARLQAGSRPEEIRQAAAQRDSAQVAVAEAEAQHQRQLDLVARNFVSQQQADAARFNLDAARARLKAADEALTLARLGPRQEDIAAARAALSAQLAAAEGLRHDIAEGALRAPADAVVEKRLLEPGDLASPQKTVLTLALTRPVWVRTYLPETALGRLPTGARATVTTDSRPDAPLQGWVGHVASTAEFTPKSVETAEVRTRLVYQARIFVCDPDGRLRQGMPATVTLAYDQPAGQPLPCPGSE